MPECSAWPPLADSAPVTEGSRIGHAPRERRLAPVTVALARPRLAERRLEWAAPKEGAGGGTMGSPTSKAHDADQLADGVGRAVELGAFLVVQRDLEHLLEAARAEPAGHAHVEAVEPVLTPKEGGAREHPLLIVDDGVDHLAHGRGRRVVGRAGLEQLDDLGAAVAGALDD